jgi:uncharacterized protein (DUF4415 family)
MSDTHIKTISLDEIEEMYERGELYHNPDAPVGPGLGADFWAKAKIVAPQKPRSVHLKLDPEVFDFFVSETNGKGHLTRMQDVLKSYMNARKAG